MLYFVQRILAAGIDLILVYVPAVLLTQILFSNTLTLTRLLPAFLFIVYNVVAVNAFKGRTVGKYFAKFKVLHSATDLMSESVREAVKIIYFLPVVGLLAMLVSCLFYVTKGQFLHDVIGKSRVVSHG